MKTLKVFIVITIGLLSCLKKVDTINYDGEDDTVGVVDNAYVHNSFNYASSIDPSINDLYAEYSYDTGLTNIPIVVIMHGYNQQVSDFADATLDRFASHKFFCLAVGMRGRDGASGSKDSSGREIHDIIDAIEYVKTNFSSIVNADKICLVGYSGGGGNALACASKFPDYFNVIVSCFGMSDYGNDSTWGWWWQESEHRTAIEGQIGGNPSTYPDRYYARKHEIAVAKNFKNGYLYLFHDQDDTSVNVSQSQRVESRYVSEGNTNYEIDISTSSDSPRWLHALPNGSAEIIQAEDIFTNKILIRNPWSVPDSGNMVICGYLVTKKFEIWLGDGTEEAAELTYNVNNDSYTITPLTGSMDVVITQGAKSASQTISSETTIIVT